jgi:hypothetical protein
MIEHIRKKSYLQQITSLGEDMDKILVDRNGFLIRLAAIALFICILSAMNSVFLKEAVVAENEATMYVGYNGGPVQNISQLTNLSFEIVTDKAIIKPGETLNISIKISNTGGENITLIWNTGSYHEISKIYHTDCSYIGFVVESPTGRVYSSPITGRSLPAISSIVFEPNQTDYINHTWSLSGNPGLATGNYTIKAEIFEIEGTPAQTLIYIENNVLNLTYVLVIAAIAIPASIGIFLIVSRARKKP